MAQSNGSPRYHALDSLRGVMMLLGVYLHVICGYSTIPDVWWYKDTQTSSFFDMNLVFIHIFRLPVFFVMAGFFAALLCRRRGTNGFVLNRINRVLIPLVGGLAVLWPILITLERYTRVWGKPDALEATVEFFLSGRYWRWLNPTHLWFLEYLLILYVLALLVGPIARRLAPDWFHRAFRAAVQSSWRPVIFAIPTFLTLCLMSLGLLDTPHSFVPVPRIVLGYAVFFGFGWLVYSHTDLLPTFRRHAWTQVAAAVGLGLANHYCFVSRQIQAMPGKDAVGFYGTAATGALVVWLLVFGCTGLFLRYLDRPIPAMRYLSDSSYWLYLFHPVVVLWVQILVAGAVWSAAAKALFVLALSVPILVASYHFAVRPTILGQVLNGRKYPIRQTRRSPELETGILLSRVLEG